MRYPVHSIRASKSAKSKKVCLFSQKIENKYVSERVYFYNLTLKGVCMSALGTLKKDGVFQSWFAQILVQEMFECPSGRAA